MVEKALPLEPVPTAKMAIVIEEVAKLDTPGPIETKLLLLLLVVEGEGQNAIATAGSVLITPAGTMNKVTDNLRVGVTAMKAPGTSNRADSF